MKVNEILLAMSGIKRKLKVLIEDAERRRDETVNLPRYKCRCDQRLAYFCPICLGKEWLTYSEAAKSYNEVSLPLGLQIPQCHICTRFESEDNPLFAYSYFEGNGYKFIYRCLKGHSHDHGLTLIDVLTGSEVHL